LDANCIDEFEQDAGFMVINKKTHWKSLHVAHYLSLYREFYYQIIDENDTFRMAWKKTNATVAWPKRFNALMGGVFMSRFCGHSFVYPDVPSAEEIEEAIARDGDRRGIDMYPPLRYLVIHTSYLGEVNPSYLRSYPFRYIQRYLADSEITYLTVYAYDEEEIGTCYELQTGLGEPEITQEMWENQYYPRFNSEYFRNGGLKGGEDRVFTKKGSKMKKASDLYAEQEEQARWPGDDSVKGSNNKVNENEPGVGTNDEESSLGKKPTRSPDEDEILDELNGRKKKPEDYEYEPVTISKNTLPSDDYLGEDDSELEEEAERRTVLRFGAKRLKERMQDQEDEDDRPQRQRQQTTARGKQMKIKHKSF